MVNEMKGPYLANKKHGYWFYYYGGRPNVKAEIVVYVKGEVKVGPHGIGPSDWIDRLN